MMPLRLRPLSTTALRRSAAKRTLFATAALDRTQLRTRSSVAGQSGYAAQTPSQCFTSTTQRCLPPSRSLSTTSNPTPTLASLYTQLGDALQHNNQQQLATTFDALQQYLVQKNKDLPIVFETFTVLRNLVLHSPLVHNQPEVRQQVDQQFNRIQQQLYQSEQPIASSFQAPVTELLPNETDIDFKTDNTTLQELCTKLNESCFHSQLPTENVKVELMDGRSLQQLHKQRQQQHGSLLGRKVCPSLTQRAYTAVQFNEETHTIGYQVYVNDQHASSLKQMGEVLLHELIHIYDLQTYSPLTDDHGHDAHSHHFHTVVVELEHTLKAEGNPITRLMRPTKGTGSIVPEGITKEQFAELLSNMINELTLAERRAYQKVLKTGNIQKDLLAAGISEEKMHLITDCLSRQPVEEGLFDNIEIEQSSARH